AGHAGARVGDLAEHGLFLLRDALHRLDQVGNEVVAALEHVLDLRPRRLDRGARLDERVVPTHEPAADQEHDHRDDRDYSQTALHSMPPQGGRTLDPAARAASAARAATESAEATTTR